MLRERERAAVDMDAPMKHERLVEAIAELVFSLPATADSPLSEHELAARFSVSRSPIRDALKVLESRGLIERKQKKGIYLKEPSLNELCEIFDLRSVLEGFAGRLAIENAGPDDIVELASLAEQFDAARESRDLEKAIDVNIAFHNKIIALSRNKLLQTMAERFQLIYRTFKTNDPVAAGIAPHIKPPYPHEIIVEKIRERDANGCESVIRAHVQSAKKQLIEQLLGIKLTRFNGKRV